MKVPERQAVVTDKRIALADQERSVSEERIFLQQLLGHLAAADSLSVKPLFTEVHLLTRQSLLQAPDIVRRVTETRQN